MSKISKNQQIEITNYINNYRNINQVGDLTWDDNISLFSQNWSDYLLTNNLFQHSATKLYGENLAEFIGYNDTLKIKYR